MLLDEDSHIKLIDFGLVAEPDVSIYMELQYVAKFHIISQLQICCKLVVAHHHMQLQVCHVCTSVHVCMQGVHELIHCIGLFKFMG